MSRVLLLVAALAVSAGFSLPADREADMTLSGTIVQVQRLEPFAPPGAVPGGDAAAQVIVIEVEEGERDVPGGRAIVRVRTNDPWAPNVTWLGPRLAVLDGTVYRAGEPVRLRARRATVPAGPGLERYEGAPTFEALAEDVVFPRWTY